MNGHIHVAKMKGLTLSFWSHEWSHSFDQNERVHPFTLDSAKSNTDTFSKITKWGKYREHSMDMG